LDYSNFFGADRKILQGAFCPEEGFAGISWNLPGRKASMGEQSSYALAEQLLKLP